ncbi:MAG: hypothetical protein H2061_07780 [Burkholderiales bacterium]|nr:hypothetical protein [Burkholderiales bacterium]OUT76625.1 MAG: hypothetical protein CBB82_07750 [Betaproteobacteria bacterium TMED22]|tara:strand:+ start:512 stop:712 length:201 start_codon:yes stop_codon:yes gene_type:complete
MAKKLGYFLIILNVVMAAYVFYLRPLSEIDPMPEKNEIYPERIQIIQDLQLEAIDTSDLGEADGSH